MSFNLKTIGQALAVAREDRGWTQRDLATKAGTTQARISKIENGETDPKLSTIIEIIRTLGIEIVLVPTKHLPAVNALVRQDNLQDRGKANGVILDQLANHLVQLRQHFPENEDLRRLDLTTRELRNFRLTEGMEKPLRDVLAAVRRVSETPALVATLTEPANAIRRLRNERAHSLSEDKPLRRAAYSLDEEDMDDD